MNLSMEWSAILIGCCIGLLSSVLSMFLQYRALRQTPALKAKMPSLVLPVSGLLGVLGLGALLLSLFTGWLQFALLMGVGVLSGFCIGLILMILAVSMLRRWSHIGVFKIGVRDEIAES